MMNRNETRFTSMFLVLGLMFAAYLAQAGIGGVDRAAVTIGTGEAFKLVRWPGEKRSRYESQWPRRRVVRSRKPLRLRRGDAYEIAGLNN